MTEPTYGLIGSGRLATHIARYLELEAQPFDTWHRGMPVRPEMALAEAEVVLLAISDDGLGPFLADHPEFRDRSVVHFSGCLTIEGAHGLHPLMTFGREVYDLETYRSIPIIEERGGPGFRNLFPGLLNPTWTIDTEHKPLYHALCVLAGNFPNLLWSKAIEEFETRLDLPREALEPFLAQTCTNAFRSGRAALTGPLVRGDIEAVALDLRALDGDPFEKVYRAFAAMFDLEEVAN